MTRKKLTLLLTSLFLLTPQVGSAAPFCNAFFPTKVVQTKLVQLKVKNQRQRQIEADAAQEALLYTLNGAEAKAIKNMIGTFSIAESGRLNYEFQPLQSGKYKNGNEVIESLDAHIDGSPTSLRIEEKSVVIKKHVEEYFRDTQSKKVAERMGLEQPLQWVARDQRPQGTQYVTFTEYGRKVGLKLASGVYAEAKARFREYYQVPTGGNAISSLYKPSLGDVIFAEIKINSKKGDYPDAFLGVQGGVFKPRIAINKAIVKELKKPDYSNEAVNISATLTRIKEKVKNLKNHKGEPANNEAKVDSYFEALERILNHDPYFLNPSLIVSYNRNSYKTETKDGEYQLTVDKDIKTWIPHDNVQFGEMNNYIGKKSSFDFNDGRFIELKSPTQAKVTESPIYVELYSHLQENHMPMFRAGSGKYHHGQPKIKDIEFTSIESSVASQGIFYWLVKSFGNLPASPKNKDINNLGVFEVAVPFHSKTGKEYRAKFGYETVTKLDGSKFAVLKKVQVVDSNNISIKSSSGEINSLLRVVQNGPENKIYTINFNNNLIMFPGKVGSAELGKYQTFMKRFYDNPTKKEGNVREPEALLNINSAVSLKAFHSRMRVVNFTRWAADRVQRAIPFALVMASSTYLMSEHGQANIKDLYDKFNIAQKESMQGRPDQMDPNVPILLKSGLESKTDSLINLIVKEDPVHDYIFIPISPINKLVVDGKLTVTFPKDNNTSVTYQVHETANSNHVFLTVIN